MKVTRNITGMRITVDKEGNWSYPESDAVLEKAGMKTIEEYIVRRKETLMKKYVKKECKQYENCVKLKYMRLTNKNTGGINSHSIIHSSQ